MDDYNFATREAAALALEVANKVWDEAHVGFDGLRPQGEIVRVHPEGPNGRAHWVVVDKQFGDYYVTNQDHEWINAG